LQIFDELQNQSPDKKTVNGHKLKARLVSTSKFFVGDAVLVIERMERTGKIRSVDFDESKAIVKIRGLLECDDRGNFTCTDADGTEVP
jgi:hypothetical protein